MSQKKFIHRINAALRKAMQIDPSVLCYGLGINDSARIFGTTTGLVEEFGEDRVFDMPTAENAMTGVGIGLAINGFRPVLSHCRLDFALLSLDQIINGAAKWYSLFAGTMPVPLTIRAIVGRGWGQGPTHCQSLQACFAHIPGLKVVMPSLAEDAYGLLLSSIFDDNPVIFIEHRWLHNIHVNEAEDSYRYLPLGQARKVIEGTDITVVAMSYMTIEALHAVKFLKTQGIHCELIDLRTIKPLDWETIYVSIRKTGRLLVLDTGFEFCSVASEIIAKASIDCFSSLLAPPKRLATPDYPVLTSPTLATPMYTYSDGIVRAVAEVLKLPVNVESLQKERDAKPRDVPGDWFGGPF
ncbi:alpha-ketoacid dehydrogenase subunit beta [Coxiella burnetii]|uniref:Pyruvate dehydrogenase E1 component beta subunit n=4 Tax=Coxiella burnetii TaxID=777 RepID=Q83DL8_COXBU|nr:transketolase C-terminal domain-containing protein [Coxiella burnetii]NP_819722.1 pyruvate dehydrogenase E1 component subunit beta [Coxiella burnetii RSA 493]AAO90236.1 pyruvate dehydrogenase E1 component beta subunit [Coxiella burnetii RSA 493]ABX78748.1 putative pyruvate dehydrogenase (acetyl-transferring) E1 component, beta subunit [Coxiella burnetii RSA 331]ACJ18624.1 pyruvate dehydrogenase E1 component beta subunit [Coxiella burnetii CbuG_Q212]ACJ20721.1 pyruvate dehydrogenase E1 compo